jgi:hypothetical protein
VVNEAGPSSGGQLVGRLPGAHLDNVLLVAPRKVNAGIDLEGKPNLMPVAETEHLEGAVT